ncbi:MAG TPA: hypothetical protein ENG45_01345 [Candidatus Aenigmarchaeota archaeon]|nr:hypothetical protein [Candidatus Aenigmarchaeota archaeon]
MKSIVEFIRDLTKEIKSHIVQTGECIGKEVIDSVAMRKGIVIDRVKSYFDERVSFIGHDYTPNEINEIKKAGSDVLVCLGENKKFFVSMEDVEAIGSLILLKRRVDVPEMTSSTVKQAEPFIKKYREVRDELRKLLPAEMSEKKGWIEKIMGE